MKVAVRYTDGTKNLLDDHVDADNTKEVTEAEYRKEYKEYIENLIRKRVATMLFEVCNIVEPKLA